MVSQISPQKFMISSFNIYFPSVPLIEWWLWGLEPFTLKLSGQSGHLNFRKYLMKVAKLLGQKY